MISQKQLIHENDWDTLIILDACRYDYFEDLYGSYLEGNLRKVRSPGLGTNEWFKKSFSQERSDTIYISANPHINSMGIKGSEAKDLFHDVVDVWDYGWEKDISNVPPDTVGEAVIEAKQNYPDKRIIAHYIQPHHPYISFQKEEINKSEQKEENFMELLKSNRKFRQIVGPIFSKFVPDDAMGELRSILDFSKPDSQVELAQKVGDENLRKFYKEDLKIALKSISNLVEKLQGKIIISSDHGELLGEKGKYGHGHNMPENREVPWLEVKV